MEAAAELEPLSSEDLFSDQNLARIDAACSEVFTMMLGYDLHLALSEEMPRGVGPVREKTAIVGFTGKIRGACEVRMDDAAATAVATAMLGGAPSAESMEESQCDAVGELCNMIAGGWKNRVPSLEARCSLAPPTVISGREYHVHPGSSVVKVARRYVFGEHAISLTLLFDANELFGS